MSQTEAGLGIAQSWKWNCLKRISTFIYPRSDETESSKISCPKRVSNFITGSLEEGLYRLCKAVGRSPWITVLICTILSGVCMIGTVNFTQMNSREELWAPQDSKVLRHRVLANKWFPTGSWVSVVLVVAKDVLTPNVLIQALEIDQKVKGLQNRSSCFRLGEVCAASSLLELWSFDEDVIRKLTKNDILQKINQPKLFSPVTHRKFVPDQILGNVKTNSSNFITNAEAMTMSYEVAEDINVFERSFVKLMDSLSISSLVDVYYFNYFSFQEALSGSIEEDLRLFAAGFLVIIVYVALVFGSWSRLHLKIWLATAGVISVGLSTGACIGLASALGEFYGPVHSALPFLLLGVGVDDMFVIIQAWNNIPQEVHHTKDVSERIGLALKHAGCSISITSLTDFLAFTIGATSVIPALRSFCIFAGIGIILDFILQTTFFVAWVAIDARRQEKKRDGCCCCIKLPDNYTESNCSRKNRMKTFFDKIFAPALLSLPGKIIAMVITAVLFGVNLYGTLMMRQYFDPILFMPPDSMAYKYTIQNEKFFPIAGVSVVIYTGDIDYFKDQSNLHKLYQVAAENKYIVESSVTSWYENYMQWTKATKNNSKVDAGKSEITDETLFYAWLQEFLESSAGKSFKNDVKFADKSGLLQISASRMKFTHKDMDSTKIEVKAMDDLREKISKMYPNDEKAFAYTRFYFQWETNKVISRELLRNLGLILASVFVVTLIVLANFWTCLMVFTCVGFTLVNIVGTMYYWGLTIDTVTTVILVLAVGLAVDYSSHIGHTFMTFTGSSTERAHVTLRDMGPAVFNGGFSTFLAFILLAFSKSYVSKTFFKVFFCVVVYGTFHGLVYLPVLMASIGPSPYGSATPAVEKIQRIQSFVQDSKLPGDNVSYELAVAGGRATPLRTRPPPAKNGNVCFPPPDYDDVNKADRRSKDLINSGFQGSQEDLAQSFEGHRVMLTNKPL